MDKTRAQFAADLETLESDLGDLRHEQPYFGLIEDRMDALLLDASPNDADWLLDQLRALLDRRAVR
ncbi:hypothetical protein [Lysobacter silvisoli]|uniref:Uncharacterized protein n=1 Tax=Lysobacter silvisoli TaxID=2293254 RepID=A0A371K5B5_9GAMM|nr:hypothetical protein [Lysobacter silvisoli]RDZ29105.1 hypothetical protein DX914_08415 [Lysobacter silvisoli]